MLQELTTRLPIILGGNLVGVYLYGSLTQGAFNPRRSDIDLIVVTRHDLSEAQFKRLGGWLTRHAKSNAWTARLQILFLIRDQVLTMNAKACLYQFGELKRSGSDGNPIIWMNVLRSGVILYGPKPETFVPEITSEILFQALKREVGYLREEMIEKPLSEWRDVPMYRAYAVLTLCRILYSVEYGTIVSKRRAARWALKQLPEQWHEIILQAVEFNDSKPSSSIPLSRIKRYIAFANGQLNTLPKKRAKEAKLF
ncbi:MAG TPA: aminoglycoside adenylyltransferase domain-containing protein [Pyrinomonadaceae bacterium]